MAEKYSSHAHWRDSARPAKFFIVDYRAAFPLLLFLLHITWWSFSLAILAICFFTLLERYGFTVVIFLRWLRSLLAGKRKFSRSWWK